ncbi:Adenylate cyclase [Minicystis rosea]|nr:Adenylate cyclase [Minicystis rosea]
MTMTTRFLSKLLPAAALVAAAGCGKSEPHGGIAPQTMADGLYAVMSADRAVYTREVVARLQDDEGVIKASEHFKDDKALPLPAQMFRMGAETARKQSPGFTYALLSQWPINKQNLPRTEIEKTGLRRVAETGNPFYGEETLAGTRYFTAVYADRAVSTACANCHNGHRDSPRHDFKQGDTLGGVVIRIALK